MVHDESGLSVLLNNAVEEKAWPELRKTGVEDGGIFLNVRETTDGLLVTADIQPRSRTSSRRTGDQYRDSNLGLHRLEALHK